MLSQEQGGREGGVRDCNQGCVTGNALLAWNFPFLRAFSLESILVYEKEKESVFLPLIEVDFSLDYAFLIET